MNGGVTGSYEGDRCVGSAGHSLRPLRHVRLRITVSQSCSRTVPSRTYQLTNLQHCAAAPYSGIRLPIQDSYSTLLCMMELLKKKGVICRRSRIPFSDREGCCRAASCSDDRYFQTSGFERQVSSLTGDMLLIKSA